MEISTAVLPRFTWRVRPCGHWVRLDGRTSEQVERDLASACDACSDAVLDAEEWCDDYGWDIP